MRQKMKRKRLWGSCLILLMLLMTACGINGKVTLGAPQEFESDVQQDEPDAQGESKTSEDDTKIQGGSDSPKPETEVQEQNSDTESAQEDTANDNLPTYGNNYYDLVNVVLYLNVYNELPPNYITKSDAQALGWEGGSVEKYKEGAAIGGDYFGNREGLLPAADGRKYTECDIDTHGYGSRGSGRLVFSNDGLYFYTSNHYESFSEVTVTENYEVIW